jgi:hypothetical protein
LGRGGGDAAVEVEKVVDTDVEDDKVDDDDDDDVEEGDAGADAEDAGVVESRSSPKRSQLSIPGRKDMMYRSSCVVWCGVKGCGLCCWLWSEVTQ